METGFPQRSCGTTLQTRQSFDAAGAGASGTGAGRAKDFGPLCFFAAAGAEVAGRGDGNGALTAGVDAAERGASGGAAAPGSGVMMLTAGVEAAVGKSALVGFPVGIVGETAASGPGGAVAAGEFHPGA